MPLLPLTLAVTEADEGLAPASRLWAPPQRPWGSGPKRCTFLVPEVTLLPWRPPGRPVRQGGGWELPHRVGHPPPRSSHREGVTWVMGKGCHPTDLSWRPSANQAWSRSDSRTPMLQAFPFSSLFWGPCPTHPCKSAGPPMWATR